MKVSEIKEEVVYFRELKVKEENLSSVVYKVEVSSKVDIKPKQESPTQSHSNSVTKKEIQSATDITLNSDQDPPSDELEVEPESQNTSDGESDTESKDDSNKEQPQQSSKTSLAHSIKSTKNISKRRKRCVKIQKKELLQCTLCPRSFPKVELLITHARKKHSSVKNQRSEPLTDDEDETLVKCPLCPKSSKTSQNLRNHFVAYHIKNKPFQCSLCLESKNEIKKFPTDSSLKQHIAKAHDPARFKFQCDICSQKFLNRSSYESHKETHTEKKYKCEYCSKAYRVRERMLRHIIAVHKEYTDRHETFKCDECEQLFCSKKDLECHVLLAHTLNTFQCKVCFKRFREEGELSKHLHVAHREKRTWLVCDVCSKAFRNNQQLVEHLEVEHKRFFKCRKCFRSFVSEQEYDSHSADILHKNGKNVKKHQLQCKICHIFLNTECSFTTHKYTHLETGEIVNKNALLLQPAEPVGCPWKCDFCPKTFFQKSFLLDHASECHPNEKRDCKICEKSFRLKYQLDKHELLHSTNKPYECKVCLKSFPNVTGLKHHEGIHTKKYKCFECKKFFTNSSGLRLHMANYHGAEKAFKCDICQKAFATKQYLEEHLRANPVEGPFDCLKCSHCYKSIEILRRHQKRCDPENPAGRIESVGPHSKYFKNRMFLCVLEKCNFQTKDEKEVAIHNAFHGLPKLVLSKELSPLMLSSGKNIKKRTVQQRFKCRYCSNRYELIRGLSKHMKKVHPDAHRASLSVHTTMVRDDYKKKSNPLHHGPGSKYAENLVFVCTGEGCNFQMKDEKKVAIHYAKHNLPKVIVPSLLYGPSSQVFLSKSTAGNKHMIRTRYKCQDCSSTFSFPATLQRHTNTFHMRR